MLGMSFGGFNMTSPQKRKLDLEIILSDLTTMIVKSTSVQQRQAFTESAGFYAQQYRTLTGKDWKDKEGRGYADYLISVTRGTLIT